MGVPLFQVDAFTSAPFAGNPAAVCLLDDAAPPSWMQSVAAEMNLSETAFVRPNDDASFSLRWFTPTVEVDLCGHATLASAHTLFETARVATSETIRFDTRSGVLTAQRCDDVIELDFPTDPTTTADPDPELLEAIGAQPVTTHRARVGWILELTDEQAVRTLAPDSTGLLPYGIVVATSRSTDPAYDFVSRTFGPAYGIDEDPVTGSSHCALAPYWAAHLGKQEMTGYQASSRGGVVTVRLEGDRTKLGGHAVTVLRGELASPTCGGTEAGSSS
jgi:PhzF family phenazine biosynthesis protein